GIAGAHGLVRVGRAALELTGTARIVQGVKVGIASFGELRGTVDVKNPLDRAVRDVVVEVTLAKDGGVADDKRAGEGDSEAGQIGATSYPIPGWKFRYTVENIAAGATAQIPCRSP